MKKTNMIWSLQFIKKCSFLILLLAFACSKSDRDEDRTTHTSVSLALSESIIFDAFKITLAAAENSKGISDNGSNTTSLFGCDAITKDTVSSPKKLNISFNGGACLLDVGRQGTIKCLVNGKINQVNGNYSASFSNYYLNGKNITGTLSVTYKGINTKTNYPLYALTATDIYLTDTAKNNTLKFNGSFSIDWTSGGSTISDVSDDIFEVTGNSNGRTLQGNLYTSKIKTAVHSLGNCFYPAVGLEEVKPENLIARELQYPSTCGDHATVFKNGEEIEIGMLR